MPLSEEEMPLKSSMEILSELFSSFNAEPPVIVKKEKDESKKHKKAKKKHKHKEKKHKKKSKKRKHSESSSSNNSEIDLAEILIKNERQSPEKKLKLELDIESDLSIEFQKDGDDTNTAETTVNDNSLHVVDVKHSKIESNIEEIDKQKKKDKHKKKHKHRDKKSKSRSRSRENSPSRHRKSRDKSRDRSKDKYRDDFKYKYERSREYKDQEKDFKNEYKSKDKEHEDIRNNKYKENPFYRSEDRYSDNEERSFYREKHKFHHDKKYRERSISSDRSVSHIDKKKLLEIARKNAIQMMKSGNLPDALNLGPQAQEKVLAAIKSGGKTIEELTDFCKSLSKQEESGDLSSISDDNGSDSENDMPFHHPFQIKERPSSITMNIKNSVPLPLKSTQERASELRMQFPVSSGQQHRRTENEWVPVSPKKLETSTQPPVKAVEPVPAPPTSSVPVVQETPAPSVPGPQVFPPTNKTEQQNIDIASIVSQRLTAMRKLQENPNDSQAICEMYRAQKEVNTWAESKQQIGQFTGSTGAQILTQAELNAGYQVWARKDQLQTAAPVSGGMGMHLLQKMGWKPGEGLGKEKTGTLEPLLLEVKLDKKGIVAKEEQKRKQCKQQKGVAKINIQGKHPVSLLGEYASKQKLGAPQYALCFECGPDHKKNFVFKVLLNGIDYKPNIASPNKKEAKANAATVCLQQLGLLPS